MKRNKSKAYRRIINAAEWQRVRAAKLRAQPLCERCLSVGIYTSAEEVHHLQPVETARDERSRRALGYNPANLQSLCHACHVAAHRELESHGKETSRRAKAKAEGFVSSWLGGGGG